MDKATQKRLDAIMEDEVQKGYRIKAIPGNLRAMLVAQGGPEIEKVRFTRLNPARRRSIASVVQTQYHKDIQNPDVLSHEQIMQLVTKRGEWSEAKSEELNSLRESVQRRMGVLYFSGEKDGVLTDLAGKIAEFKNAVDKSVPEDNRAYLIEIFDRWVEYTEAQREVYTKNFAASQKRETYSPDSDFQRMVVLAQKFEFKTMLEDIESLRDRVQDLLMLRQDRIKLDKLQTKYAKIFSDSAEQRREVAEEVARVFFTCERLDEQDKPVGKLVDDIQELYEFPEEVIQWFQFESYFFHNGIPDEAREYLTAIGFLPAEQDSTDPASPNSESEVSAESPAPQNSKADSAPVVETAAVSSESPAVTS
jgi:ATP-dependent Lon protease